MSEPIIKLENISKQYRLGLVGTNTLRGDIQRWWYRMRGKEDPTLKIGEENQLDSRAGEYVWALRDINLEVQQGEVLGIIGKNGAGKSTLLKILSRVTGPTTGRITAHGRIASLLEVGTGFHPELTGRENIYLNGAILGMTKQEIRSKFDEIVDFAGVAKYVDTPVKRYSSGMYVRLAFAVAAHLEPEILIVDEVLAVGDAEFQKKAIGKMQDISKGGGRTVLFVSHNMASVQKLCTRAIFMENGKISFIGETNEVVNFYLNKNGSKEKRVNSKIYDSGAIQIVRAEVVSPLDKFIKNGQEIKIKFGLNLKDKIKFNPVLYVFRNETLAFFSSDFHKPIISKLDSRGEYTLEFIIPPYLLNPGKISFDFGLSSTEGRIKQIIKVEDILSFELWDDNYRRGEQYNLGWEGAVSPILKYKIDRV